MVRILLILALIYLIRETCICHFWMNNIFWWTSTEQYAPTQRVGLDLCPLTVSPQCLHPLLSAVFGVHCTQWALGALCPWTVNPPSKIESVYPPNQYLEPWLLLWYQNPPNSFVVGNIFADTVWQGCCSHLPNMQGIRICAFSSGPNYTTMFCHEQ